MIKFLWYLISLLTIILILFNSPQYGSLDNFVNQNNFINFSSNQLVIQQLIVLSICLFLVLTIFCVIY